MESCEKKRLTAYKWSGHINIHCNTVLNIPLIYFRV